MILIAIANMIPDTVPHRIPYAIPNLMLHMLLNAIRLLFRSVSAFFRGGRSTAAWLNLGLGFYTSRREAGGNTTVLRTDPPTKPPTD